MKPFEKIGIEGAALLLLTAGVVYAVWRQTHPGQSLFATAPASVPIAVTPTGALPTPGQTTDGLSWLPSHQLAKGFSQ